MNEVDGTYFYKAIFTNENVEKKRIYPVDVLDMSSSLKMCVFILGRMYIRSLQLI